MPDAPPPPPPPPPASARPEAVLEAPTVRALPPVRPLRPPRAGQLTTGWQIMVAVSWAAAFLALAGVWKASEEVGIATWWLGPRADPHPTVVRILPFVLVVAIALCAVYNVRFVSWISLGGATAIAVMAVVDLSYMTGLAIAEFAIAGGLGMVSIASFGGRYRVDPANGSSAGEDPADAAVPSTPVPPAAG